jgi:hypothetical protein
LPGCGHAERALQVSWWQEHGAAHAGGPRAQQAGKLETRVLFAGSQGGTIAPAGGNTCAPRSVRLDLKAPGGPAVGYGPPRTIYLTDIDASGKPPRTIYLTGIDASGKVAEVGWDRYFSSCVQTRAKYREKPQGRPVGTHHCKFLSSHPRVSYDGRDRALDGGRQEVESLRPSGRNHDPDWLPPRLAGVRIVRSAMVAG